MISMKSGLAVAIYPMKENVSQHKKHSRLGISFKSKRVSATLVDGVTYVNGKWRALSNTIVGNNPSRVQAKGANY